MFCHHFTCHHPFNRFTFDLIAIAGGTAKISACILLLTDSVREHACIFMILPALMHNFFMKLIDRYKLHYLPMQTIAMILGGKRRRGAIFGLALFTVHIAQLGTLWPQGGLNSGANVKSDVNMLSCNDTPSAACPVVPGDCPH